MIKLNLTATRQWLDLAPGLRLLVGPLTTALMVSARADAAIETMPDTATTEELALAMAKAVARRAVLDWEGVGDDAGNMSPFHWKASTPFWKSGRFSRRSGPNTWLAA